MLSNTTFIFVFTHITQIYNRQPKTTVSWSNNVQLLYQ
ncbi:hypothetical protein KUCAC02_025844 [Chaenocephalus aceratus]|uniref:Uncharacterized protein n=1 Tax=Chaenocephalus aceratus TaxID=36190 RepID=A0ACB9VVS0_CHAAC|nr:hypothetical protein KUCAC02_025844 [Chaenocephalus aceratus]